MSRLISPVRTSTIKMNTEIEALMAIDYNPQVELDMNMSLAKPDQIKLRMIIEKHYLNATPNDEKPPYEMKINLTNDTPFHSLPRRLSYHERGIL